MKPRRKAKGGVQRNTKGLESAAKAYVEALDRRDRFRADMADKLAQLAELDEVLDAATQECALQAQRHLTGRTTTVSAAGAKFTRTQKNSRVISAEKLLGRYPKLHLVNGLFKVVAGSFDKVAASGAYDADVLADAVHTDTTFHYHVQKQDQDTCPTKSTK